MVSKDVSNLEHTLKRLHNSHMLPHNKDKIFEYFNEKVANGVKKTSYAFVLRVLIRLGDAFPSKKFEGVSKPEMVSFINDLKPEKHVLPQRHGGLIEFDARPFSESTLWQYKVSIKTFYRWLFGVASNETAPDAVKWIRKEGHKNGQENAFKKEVLSIREVTEMIKAARNPRDKAVIAVLWETGLRASEFLGMRKSGLHWHSQYVEFEVSGKTGKRNAIVVQSKPHLELWLNELEKKRTEIPEKLSDFIWLSFNKRGLKTNQIGEKLLTRDNLNNLLKINAGRAGVSKRVWTHGLRHSAATRDAANGWNEAKLRIKFGWSRKSSMPSVYTHLANSDLKDTVLEENGIVEHKEKREKSLLENTVKCLFCFSVNLKESDYCAKCGKPLNTEQLKNSNTKPK
jgi:integrase/recombinase XerD